MSNPFIGEIRMFGGSFAPAGWAFCNGALQPIAENQALYSLIGTTYGGDGQSTYGLPNLQGRIPIHAGQGPGLSQNYVLGEMGGSESVTLNVNQMPIHSHVLVASTDAGTTGIPSTSTVLAANLQVKVWSQFTPNVNMGLSAIPPVGGSQPHDNMMPFLVITFIISLFGVFPSQN